MFEYTCKAPAANLSRAESRCLEVKCKFRALSVSVLASPGACGEGLFQSIVKTVNYFVQSGQQTGLVQIVVLLIENLTFRSKTAHLATVVRGQNNSVLKTVFLLLSIVF